MSEQSTKQISDIIEEITSSSWEKGTREYKIAALYNSILDKENRNKHGIEPIKKYLELVDAAENIDDLIIAHNTIFKDTCLSVFFEFALTVDMKNSTKHMLYFSTISPMLQKEFYLEDNPKKEMYLTHLFTMFELGGETKDNAAIMAQQYIDTEKVLAEKMLDVADQCAVSCITEIVSGLENPDYKALYESIAKCWASTFTRDYASYLAQVDVHSAAKLRVNRVVVTCDEFYEAYGITENDGMYVAPENRVKVW